MPLCNGNGGPVLSASPPWPPFPSAPVCPIRLVCFRLAAKGSTKARHLFLDGEGQICAAPHWLPREQALLLDRNQQLICGSAARMLVL